MQQTVIHICLGEDDPEPSPYSFSLGRGLGPVTFHIARQNTRHINSFTVDSNGVTVNWVYSTGECGCR